MSTIIIAPACMIPSPGTNPDPNLWVMIRATELANANSMAQPVIFTDLYTQPTRFMPPNTRFIRAGRKGNRSTVAFLRRAKRYTDRLNARGKACKIICVVAPHYIPRFTHDFHHIFGFEPKIDKKLLKTPVKYFFAIDGKDLRSRHYSVWLAREVLLTILARISWRLYAWLTG